MLQRPATIQSHRRSSPLLAALLVVAMSTASGTTLLAQNPANTDRNGDPLPTGALARLGTLRWRHAEPVRFVAFLPDGKAVLTGGLDNTLRLWDRATGKELRRFTLPAAKTVPGMMRAPLLRLSPAAEGHLAAALAPDGKTLAAAGADSKVYLWDVATGKEIRTFAGPSSGVMGLFFAPDGRTLAMRASDHTVHLMACATGAELRRLGPKKAQPPARVPAVLRFLSGIAGLAFAPDGKTLASAEVGSDDQQQVSPCIRISEVETGEELRTIKMPLRPGIGGVIVALAYSPDGKFLACAMGNAVHVLDADTGKEIRQVKSPGGVLGRLVFAPDSKTLAGKGANMRILRWDITTGKELPLLDDYPASAGNGAPTIRFPGGPFATLASAVLAFAPDGKTVATGDGNVVRLFNTDSGKEQGPAGGHRGPVSTLTVTADGKTLVSRGADGMVRCWDLAAGRALSAFREPAGTICVAIAPDGKTIAYAGNGPSIQMFHIATGAATLQLKGHVGGTGALAFAPDGKLLASAGTIDNAIRLHDAVKGTLLRQAAIAHHHDPMAEAVVVRAGTFAGIGLAFSADGRTLVSYHSDSSTPASIAGGVVQTGAANATTLRLWDVAAGKERRKIALPAGRGVGGMAVAPDGRTIAVEDRDGTRSLWEAASGRERLRLGELKPPAPDKADAMMGFALIRGALPARPIANTVAFTPDGRLLACQGPDRSVRVWEASTGKQVATFKGHAGAVLAMLFTPDGKRLATGSADTTILVWDTAGLTRESAPAGPALTAEQAAQCWADLAGEDAAKAFQSIRRLAAHPQVAVPLVRAHLKPAVPADPKRIAKLTADLDSDDFTVRDAANRELAKLGELAQPALEQIMKGTGTLERRRRAEALLAKLTAGALTPDQLRQVRAVEALERAATPEARQLLEALAKGAPGVLSTREAQAAMGRLGAARPR